MVFRGIKDGIVNRELRIIYVELTRFLSFPRRRESIITI